MTKGWRVGGSYFEVCSCKAICPCRRHGGRAGGRSNFATCDFALSWHIEKGNADGLDVSGLDVVLVGSYSDDEPGSPWRVILYVDEGATAAQQAALADIFLGRAGGETLRNFAKVIGEVHAIRSARIETDHTPNHERMIVAGLLSASTARPFVTDETISCGIPGHDRPGREIVGAEFRLDDAPFRWEFDGRCGFATDFEYSSDG